MQKLLQKDIIKELIVKNKFIYRKEETMFQSRTHNCNELRIANVGENVRLVGWMENVREVGKNFAFIVLRDFY